MAHFMVRVELHQPYTEQTYDKLHAAMATHGYFRFIQANDGAFYQLPSAEYSHYDASNSGPFQILDSVATIVSSVHWDFEVFVGQTESWAARGLKRQ